MNLNNQIKPTDLSSLQRTTSKIPVDKTQSAPVSDKQPVSNTKAAKLFGVQDINQLKPDKILGGLSDLTQIKDVIKKSDSVDLQARVKALEGSKFKNAFTQFFHKLIGTETYKSFSQAKANLEQVQDLRTQSRILMSEFESTKSPETQLKAQILSAKADLLQRPCLDGEILNKALSTLNKTPEGKKELMSLAGFDNYSQGQISKLASTQTTSLLEKIDKTHPARGFILRNHITPEELAINDLKSLMNDEKGFSKSFFGGFAPQATLGDKIESLMLQEYMKMQLNENEANFMKMYRDIALKQPGPSLEDLRAINQAHMFRAEVGLMDSKQINVGGQILQEFDHALQNDDLVGAMKKLHQAAKGVVSMYENDSYKRFDAWKTGAEKLHTMLPREYSALKIGGKTYSEAMQILAKNKPELGQVVQVQEAMEVLTKNLKTKTGFIGTFNARFDDKAPANDKIASHMLEEYMKMMLNENEVGFMHAVQKLVTKGSAPTLEELEQINKDFMFKAKVSILSSNRINIDADTLKDFDEAIQGNDLGKALATLNEAVNKVHLMYNNDALKRFDDWREGRAPLHSEMPMEYRQMGLGGKTYNQAIEIISQNNPQLRPILKNLSLLSSLEQTGLR